MSAVISTASSAPVITPPTVTPVHEPDGALTTPESTATRKAQRADQRKRRQGHATDGASSRNYAVAKGREAVPAAPARFREKICSFIPTSAAQINQLRLYFRQLVEQEVIFVDGSTGLLKLKPSTQDDVLALSLTTEYLKNSYRALIAECLQDHFIAPTGLPSNLHSKSQMLLDCFGPEHILAWAQEQDQPVYQDLAREVATAWGDPEAEGLPCCQAAVSLKPKATEVQGYIQAFGERAARWPEGLRPLLGDLVKILTQCNASKLHDYLCFLQHLLTLSSAALHDELLSLGKSLPKSFALVALLQPKEWLQSGSNLHKFLLTTMVKKRAARKRSTKRTAKASAAATTTPLPTEDSATAEPTIISPTPEAQQPSTTPEAPSPEVAADAEAPSADAQAQGAPVPAETSSAETPADSAEATADTAEAPCAHAQDETLSANAQAEAPSGADPADAATAEPNADALPPQSKPVENAPAGAEPPALSSSAEAATEASPQDEDLTPDELEQLREEAIESICDALSGTSSEHEAKPKARLHKQQKRHQHKLARQQRKQARRHRK